MKTPPITEPEETDVYREILNLYVGSDPLRPAMHTPFFQDEYVLATDAHLMICFGANRLKTIDFTPLENTPNALKVLTDVKNNCNVEFETIELRNAITKLNNTFNDNYKIVKTECPDCDGRGWVYYEFDDYEFTSHEIKGDCPTCVEKQDWISFENLNTGEVCEDINLLLHINKTIFNAQLVEKLVITAEKLQAENIILVHKSSEYRPHKFLIHDTTVIIMPIIRDGVNDISISINQPSIS